MNTSIFFSTLKLLIILTSMLAVSGCASLVVKPYEQYDGGDRAELKLTSNTLNVSTPQTYVTHKDCTERRRMDGVGGEFRSPTDLHYLPPNQPFVVSVYASRGSELCIYSLSFTPEPGASYKLNIELDQKNYCLSQFTQKGEPVESFVANALPDGVVESSPFCKGHFFQAIIDGSFETTAYTQYGFETVPQNPKR